MRLDKALQNIVYKLVPGLHTEEMERRKKFTEKHEPTKVPKEELEKHFFFCNDKISMSLEYYDTEKSKNNNDHVSSVRHARVAFWTCTRPLRANNVVNVIH